MKNCDKLVITGSVISFLLFSVILKFNGISSSTVINIQNSFIMAFLSSSSIDFISPFIWILISMTFLALSFSFLAFYGFKTDDSKTGTISGVINAIVSIAFFPTVAGLLIAVSMIAASGFVVQLSNTYSKELKKWIKFRAGSNSVSKALLIFNILVALSIIISVGLNSSHYQNNFKADIREAMLSAVLNDQEIPNNLIIQQQVDAQLNTALNSPFFLSYFKWMPVIAGLSAFVILEFFRNILFSNIAGLLTFILIQVGYRTKN